MPNSMTAFARHQTTSNRGELVWELRSINHRYLEPQFRLPEGTRQLEPELRERLKSRITRGKVECNLQLRFGGENFGLAIDESLLERLDEALTMIAAKTRAELSLSAIELLRWPGVLREQSIDGEELEAMALAGFEAALEKLDEGRAREGGKLCALVLARIDGIDLQLADLQRALPALKAAQRQRLDDRLAELALTIDGPRLEQELVYMAQRTDVEEELDRLSTHLDEVRRVLDKPGPCGRRLDFLMQELNREANTLGSKTSAREISASAIEIKVLIEQMREQVQNIE